MIWVFSFLHDGCRNQHPLTMMLISGLNTTHFPNNAIDLRRSINQKLLEEAENDVVVVANHHLYLEINPTMYYLDLELQKDIISVDD